MNVSASAPHCHPHCHQPHCLSSVVSLIPTIPLVWHWQLHNSTNAARTASWPFWRLQLGSGHSLVCTFITNYVTETGYFSWDSVCTLRCASKQSTETPSASEVSTIQPELAQSHWHLAESRNCSKSPSALSPYYSIYCSLSRSHRLTKSHHFDITLTVYYYHLRRIYIYSDNIDTLYWLVQFKGTSRSPIKLSGSISRSLQLLWDT